MQTAKPKASQRQKEPKTANQTKISGFFTKPKDAQVHEASNGLASSTVPQETASQPLPPQAELNRPQARPLNFNPLPQRFADEKRVEREIIVIDDSPVRPVVTIQGDDNLGEAIKRSAVLPLFREPLSAIKEKKAVHPFFSKATSAIAPPKHGTLKSNPSQSATSKELPPWPTSESMHCGLSSTRHSPRTHIFPRKSAKALTSVKKESSLPPGSSKRNYLSSLVEPTSPQATLSQPSQRLKYDPFEVLQTIPEAHRLQKAISRLIAQHGVSFPPHRIWNEKYAPRSPEEVIHNTEKAIYLQRWLRALEVQMDGPETGAPQARGVKRPRPKVQRDVGKKRGRKRQKISDDPFGGLDDFIADDDEWDSNEDDEDDDGFLSLEEDLPRTSTISSPVSSRGVSPPPPPLILPRGTRSRPSARRIIKPSPPISPAPVVVEPAAVEKVDSGEVKDELPLLTERLTNTILLSGPCGSGKTASVYACAEELNWKVFEFYPGIGKRSGAGFIAEVGGTGDNHRVGGMEKDQGGLNFPQTLGFLTSPSKKGVPSAAPLSGPSHDNNDVRQSLILIEEADILYQSDGNLWPTLIDFIRKSRRPVILTCNDESLIPQNDIPLQAVLKFEACDVELATSYLQAISIAEGSPIDRTVAQRISTADGVYFPMEADVPDQPSLPVPSQGRLVVADLKKAINHLQISLTTFCDTIGTHERSLDGFGNWSQQSAVMPDAIVEMPGDYQRKRSQNEELETILQLGEFLESISFGDTHVARRMVTSLELGSIDRHGPSSDDTLGHTLLGKSQEPEEAFGVALCPRDEDMAVRVAYHARLRLEQRGYGEIVRRELVPWTVTRSLSTQSNRGAELGLRWGFDTMHLALARSEYQGRIVKALDEKMGLSSVLLPRPGCVLDYIPWMQETVRGMQGDCGWMSSEGTRVLLTEGLVSAREGWLSTD